MNDGIEQPEDIDPKLLKESGRASAIQDLAKEAKELADRGAALEQTTISEMTKQNTILRDQNKLLIFMVLVLVALGGWQTYRALFISGPKIDAIQETVEGPISDANEKLDEIILFIEEVQEAQETPQPVSPQLQEVFDAVFEIRDLICVAQDQPEITEACNTINSVEENP